MIPASFSLLPQADFAVIQKIMALPECQLFFRGTGMPQAKALALWYGAMRRSRGIWMIRGQSGDIRNNTETSQSRGSTKITVALGNCPGHARNVFSAGAGVFQVAVSEPERSFTQAVAQVARQRARYPPATSVLRRICAVGGFNPSCAAAISLSAAPPWVAATISSTRNPRRTGCSVRSGRT